MEIEWSHIISASIGYLLVIILRTILDFSVAPYLVKKLHWIHLRTFIRNKFVDLSGNWDQVWDYGVEEESFQHRLERSSLAEMKQLGNHVYAEFSSAGINYQLFGRIKGNFITGEWYDAKNPFGYYGSFELRIHDLNLLDGRWIGHSKKSNEIYGDKWIWRKHD